jgi:hypothetical protein
MEEMEEEEEMRVSLLYEGRILRTCCNISYRIRRGEERWEGGREGGRGGKNKMK